MFFLYACSSSDPVAAGRPREEQPEDTDTPAAEEEQDTSSEPVADAAVVVGASFPTELDCGETDTATVVMRNTGTATWTRADGYKLGAVDDSDPFYSLDTRVWLEEGVAVAPGATHTFEVPLTAERTEGAFTTDWRMVHEGVTWFGETSAHDVRVACVTTPPRTGRVTLDGNSLSDDGGRFNALGASMFWAAWAYRNDREKLERNLQALSENGFHYVRALGVVGDYEEEDYWDGREIDWHWSDYADVIAGLTDLAYDSYGLRVEWTLIGDGQLNIPDEDDRYRLVDTFLAMSEGREEKIVHFEIANEAWQNGFEGDEGIDQLRALTRYMQDRTDILVAASAPQGVSCEDYELVYGGGVGDLATIHFDRDTSLTDGDWRPVRQPWELEYCGDVPVGSNNEPIGPGSSVASEEEPVKLAAAAIATHVANLPLYVYHTRAGVRGDSELYDMEGFDAFRHVHTLVPGDLASWERKNAHWSDAPFQAFAVDRDGTEYADQMWTDLDDPAAGAVRVYSGVSGGEFFSFAFGILDRLILEPRQAMAFTAWEPVSGDEVGSWTLAEGERVELTGYEALVLRGNYR